MVVPVCDGSLADLSTKGRADRRPLWMMHWLLKSPSNDTTKQKTLAFFLKFTFNKTLFCIGTKNKWFMKCVIHFGSLIVCLRRGHGVLGTVTQNQLGMDFLPLWLSQHFFLHISRGFKSVMQENSWSISILWLIVVSNLVGLLYKHKTWQDALRPTVLFV